VGTSLSHNLRGGRVQKKKAREEKEGETATRPLTWLSVQMLCLITGLACVKGKHSVFQRCLSSTHVHRRLVGRRETPTMIPLSLAREAAAGSAASFRADPEETEGP
jgi:hypothetical protein